MPLGPQAILVLRPQLEPPDPLDAWDMHPFVLRQTLGAAAEVPPRKRPRQASPLSTPGTGATAGFEQRQAESQGWQKRWRDEAAEEQGAGWRREPALADSSSWTASTPSSGPFTSEVAAAGAPAFAAAATAAAGHSSSHLQSESRPQAPLRQPVVQIPCNYSSGDSSDTAEGGFPAFASALGPGSSGSGGGGDSSGNGGGGFLAFDSAPGPYSSSSGGGGSGGGSSGGGGSSRFPAFASNSGPCGSGDSSGGDICRGFPAFASATGPYGSGSLAAVPERNLQPPPPPLLAAMPERNLPPPPAQRLPPPPRPPLPASRLTAETSFQRPWSAPMSLPRQASQPASNGAASQIAPASAPLAATAPAALPAGQPPTAAEAAAATAVAAAAAAAPAVAAAAARPPAQQGAQPGRRHTQAQHQTAPAGKGAQRQQQNQKQKAPSASAGSRRQAAAAHQPPKQLTQTTLEAMLTPPSFRASGFEGIELLCHNAAASQEGLELLLELCSRSPSLALALLWADGKSSFTVTSAKHCTPSKPCARWYCTCDRVVRASQARAPLVGAIISLVEPEENFLLPLAPCVGDQTAAPAAAPAASGGGGGRGSGPGGVRAAESLPFQCAVPLEGRWRALQAVLAVPGAAKVVFHAQLAVMPLVARERTRGASYEGKGSGGGKQGGGEGAVTDLFDPRVAAWMLDTCKGDTDLELSQLLAAWAPDAAAAAAAAAAPDVSSGGGGGAGGKATGTAAVASVVRDLRAALALAERLGEELVAAGLWDAFRTVEMSIVPVLARMEVTGICFLPDRVRRLEASVGELADRLAAAVTAQIAAACGAAAAHGFNPASPEQVAHALYALLRLPAPPKRANAKHPSTSNEVLEGLVDKHPVVGLILEHRAANKVRSTYLTTLSAHAVGCDSAASAARDAAGRQEKAARIHAQWNQLAVRTGRLSCSKPNLQQIPKDYESVAGSSGGDGSGGGGGPTLSSIGVNIRDAFSATRGYTLVAADWSQIEVRIMAHCCGDPLLCQVFSAGTSDASGGGGRSGGTAAASSSSPGGRLAMSAGSDDLYAALASRVFAKAPAAVSKEEREQAKVVCLGLIYGMGAQQAAKKLGVDVRKAQALLATFRRSFPGVEAFVLQQRQLARQMGFVQTITGRRRHLPEIKSSNDAARAQAERQAVNSVIQGSAADVIKVAMAAVERRLAAWRAAAGAGAAVPRLVLQIHDELVFECPASEADIRRLQLIVREEMEEGVVRQLNIKVPIKCKMSVGVAWGSLRPMLG